MEGIGRHIPYFVDDLLAAVEGALVFQGQILVLCLDLHIFVADKDIAEGIGNIAQNTFFRPVLKTDHAPLGIHGLFSLDSPKRTFTGPRKVRKSVSLQRSLFQNQTGHHPQLFPFSPGNGQIGKWKMIRRLIRGSEHLAGSDFSPVLTHIVAEPGLVALDDAIHINAGEGLGVCHPDENRGGSGLQLDLLLTAIFLLIPWLCSHDDRNISQRMNPESSASVVTSFESRPPVPARKASRLQVPGSHTAVSCMKDHIVVTFKFSVSPNPLAHMCTSPFLVSGRLPAFFLHPKTLLQTAACGLRRRNSLPQVFVTGTVSHCLIIRI